VHKRVFSVLVGSLFVLTLLFAVAAGAQASNESPGTSPTEDEGAAVEAQAKEDATDEVAGEAQDQAAKDQDTQDQGIENQSAEDQAVESQAQESEAVQAQAVQAQAASCPGARTRGGVTEDPTTRRVIRPDISGGAVRVTYNFIGENDADDELVFTLTDEDGNEVLSETVSGQTDGPQEIRVDTSPGQHKFVVEADDGVNYSVRLEDCTNVEARDDNNDNNSNDSTNTTDTTTDTVTDDVTTQQTATDPTSSADPNSSASADAQTADDFTGANGANGVDRAEGAFRCELFLRVEDDNGFDGRFGRRHHAGFLQYFDGDEDLLVQRIEQCREREVLADTIPDRRLPGTGGPPLALLAAGVLLVSGLGAGASVFRAGTRRRR
jgi:hypothetical protein